ncbi:hypothetical protein IQ07DRAFT_98297 [Pyrenochaeta sp. DS3sAY3a]|nr:hypothetical protein IQ07DRAFT_98297 [Pyrenochaeta sp. DS3sAY3a]
MDESGNFSKSPCDFFSMQTRHYGQNSRTASHIYKYTNSSFHLPALHRKPHKSYLRQDAHAHGAHAARQDSRNRAYIGPSRHVLHRLQCPSFRSCPNPTNGVATPCTPKAQNVLSQPEHQPCFFLSLLCPICAQDPVTWVHVLLGTLLGRICNVETVLHL